VTLDVTVLGSSAMYATLDRACSGYLVAIDGKNLLLDAGAGVWRNLLRHIDYDRIDGVLLTHRHPDHTTDLFQVFHARRYGDTEAMPRIPLWAPAETMDRISAFSTELDEAFDLRTIAAGQKIEVLGCSVSLFEMAHPPETLGVRLDLGDVALAYSADTGPDADFDGLAGRSDVFICEATYQDGDDPWFGHLFASQVGEIANRVGAGKVVLTHLPPGRDPGLSLTQAVHTAGDSEVRLAADGLSLEVGS
jgi:ribonuclease BN (tRNA processing enzyme)